MADNGQTRRAPRLLTHDGREAALEGMYHGATGFLLCAGPSLLSHDLSKLQQRGIVTCAVNNAAAVFRPHLWVCVDDPSHFCDAVWRDPGIVKFVPVPHFKKPITQRGPQDELVLSSLVVGDMPAVFGYERNENFVAERWLYEDTFNWGNHGKTTDAYGNRGSRSVMYVALRLMFHLGIRRLYLLGCDFRMDLGKQNYAFDQHRSRTSVRGNNKTYQVFNARLAHLKPYFDQEGYEVFNCTPDSGLTVFGHVPFDDAVASALAGMPKKMITAGMYDRVQREKDAAKALKSPAVSADRPAAEGDYSACPEMTLVVGLNEETAAIWRHTWPTWMRFKPWLRRMPLLVIHDGSAAVPEGVSSLLGEHPQATFLPYATPEGMTAGDGLLAALIALPAQHVTTPWYLELNPRALATGFAHWLTPEWFQADERGRLPALVASPWGYTKPADAIAQLDDWADTVPSLRAHPRLDLPFDPQASCVRHETIASWLLLARTDWVREVARFTPARLPIASHAAYLNYCARRQGEIVKRIQMKQFGWDHSYRGANWFAAQSREVVA